MFPARWRGHVIFVFGSGGAYSISGCDSSISCRAACFSFRLDDIFYSARPWRPPPQDKDEIYTVDRALASRRLGQLVRRSARARGPRSDLRRGPGPMGGPRATFRLSWSPVRARTRGSKKCENRAIRPCSGASGSSLTQPPLRAGQRLKLSTVTS